MSAMYNVVKQLYNNTLDDAIRLHAQLALEQIERIAKEILFPEQRLPNKIEML